ncbi:MAG: Rho termination factor N-terminal domain-containing protein [Pseudomonadota bacterium]|nr:Rho termination factor N-terminal domain-containing protein [Pseudomonadota bacterium]
MAKPVKVTIKLTSAVVIEGVICKAGQQVEVAQDLAKDLLNRGRGTLLEDASDESDEIDLSKMTKAQLVEVALEYEIENPDALNKADLIDAISAKANAEDD